MHARYQVLCPSRAREVTKMGISMGDGGTESKRHAIVQTIFHPPYRWDNYGLSMFEGRRTKYREMGES